MAMIFATPASLVANYPNQIYNVLKVSDGADISANAKALAACEQANSEAEMHLAGVVTVPLELEGSEYPALVRNATEIAFWILLNDRMESVTEADRARVKDARRFFENLASGKIRMAIVPSAVAVAGAKGGLFERPSVSGVDPFELY
jgi:phage gp36-like protein